MMKAWSMDFDLTDHQRQRYDELVEAIGDRLGGRPALDAEAGMRAKWKEAAGAVSASSTPR